MPKKLGQVKIIEWDKWREHRGVSTSTIEDIESWTREAVSSTAAYTTVLTVNEETPCVDSHLLHLWDARWSLTRRWKNQRLNRKLKIKVQEISHKADEYAAELTRQNWYNLCDNIQGQLSSASTWRLLRPLLDPNNTRTATSHSRSPCPGLRIAFPTPALRRLAVPGHHCPSLAAEPPRHRRGLDQMARARRFSDLAPDLAGGPAPLFVPSFSHAQPALYRASSCLLRRPPDTFLQPRLSPSARTLYPPQDPDFGGLHRLQASQHKSSPRLKKTVRGDDRDPRKPP
ncbi:hypothetical protein HPB47_006460 [Ixodes persulcatus]|uniref:Uncharacterized protein n=1 Tax=Ixodes persulcatus TaxID=34615 RepID=A0AC60PAS6_IXOPE|nr:hypothetical protein HPB47_006460 [Ixodes persulcatus]